MFCSYICFFLCDIYRMLKIETQNFQRKEGKQCADEYSHVKIKECCIHGSDL